MPAVQCSAVQLGAGTKKGDAEQRRTKKYAAKEQPQRLWDETAMEEAETKKKVLVELIGGGGIKREMPAFKISESLPW